MNRLGRSLATVTLLALGFLVPLSAAYEHIPNSKSQKEYTDAYNLYRSSHFSEAVEHLNACVAADSKHPLAWSLLGLAQMNLGHLPEAEEAFKRSIQLNAKDNYAYNNLGRVYMREKNLDEAEKAFRKQLEVSPHDKYATYNLGLLLRDRGNYEESIKQMQEAEFYSPPNAKLYVDLGEIYLRAGQPDKAKAEFDKAAELSPTPRVWNSVAYALARHQTDLDKAKKLAESAIAITETRLRTENLEHPTRREFDLSAALASYWDTLGWVYFQQAEYEKAEPYLKSSWQVSHHGEVAEHLGDLAEKRGNKEAAAKWYALGAASGVPSSDAKDKLQRLAPQNADEMKAAAKDALNAESRLRITSPGHDGNFQVAIAYSSDSQPTITFLSKDAAPDLVPELKRTKFPVSFPDSSPTTLLLASNVKCVDATCDLLMLAPESSTRDESLPMGATEDSDMPRSTLPRDVTPPRVIKSTDPVYPREARMEGVQGVVVLEVKINTEGNPEDIRPVNGNHVFYEAAVDAVKKWKFVPASRQGTPIPILISVEVAFKLYPQ